MRIILPGILLMCSTVTDIKRREISGFMMGIFLLLGSLCLFFGTELSFGEILGGVGLGLFMVLISLATGGELGLGDGILICVTGMFLGFKNNLMLLLGGLLLSAIFSMILVACGSGLKKEYPFVPFLLASYLLILFGGGNLL